MSSQDSRPVMVALLTLTIAITGCASASSSPSQPQGADALCAGTTFTRCVPNMTLALQQGWKRIAICEYPNGEGEVVQIEEGNNAAGMCEHLAPNRWVGAREVDVP